MATSQRFFWHHHHIATFHLKNTSILEYGEIIWRIILFRVYHNKKRVRCQRKILSYFLLPKDIHTRTFEPSPHLLRWCCVYILHYLYIIWSSFLVIVMTNCAYHSVRRLIRTHTHYSLCVFFFPFMIIIIKSEK